MCRNGRYRERGIKELDRFGAERVALEPEYAVKVDPALGSVGVLVEPAAVLAKACEQIDRVAAQACRPLESVFVTGAGPIGLPAALLGAQRDHRVHVLDRATDGPKPALAAAALAPATTAVRSVRPARRPSRTSSSGASGRPRSSRQSSRRLPARSCA
jgi:glucose 1-dehydrogenase